MFMTPCLTGIKRNNSPVQNENSSENSIPLQVRLCQPVDGDASQRVIPPGLNSLRNLPLVRYPHHCIQTCQILLYEEARRSVLEKEASIASMEAAVSRLIKEKQGLIEKLEQLVREYRH